MAILKKLAIPVVFLAGVIYLLYTPVPETIDDRRLYQMMSPLLTFNFYIGSAFWYLGFDTHTVFNFGLRKAMNAAIKYKHQQYKFPSVEFTDTHIEGVKVRVYIPKNRKSQLSPGVIYIHGGGYTLNSPEIYHYQTGTIAERLQAVLISIDYSKAPAVIYPDPLDEIYRVVTHFMKQAAKYQVDPKRIAIGGDSAGGHSTLSVMLKMLADKNFPKDLRPRALYPIYPATQMISFNTPSMMENKNDPLLSRTLCTAFRAAHLVGHLDDVAALLANNHSTPQQRKHLADAFDLPELAHRGPAHLDAGGDAETLRKYSFAYEDPLLSPLLADNFRGFPPTFVITCQFDILRDEGVMLARRLEKDNVNVIHKNYNSFHGILNFADRETTGVKVLEDIVTYLERQLK